MISIILFILIGIKLEMGAAYYCIIGLRAGLLIGEMTMKAIERHEKKRLLKELGESLDGLIDDAGVWKIDKDRKAKVDREQNENQEETKHE